MSSIMNFEVFDKKITEIDLQKHRIINTINPHSYFVTKEDPYFDHVLKNSDVLLPDGIGIVWAARFINNQKITKIAGYDIFQYIMNKLECTEGSCFFLGASVKALDLIEKRIKIEFPNVEVNSFSPPFKKKFSEEDNKKMIAEVNQHNPTVLFVGMTAPKQEKWAFKHKDKLNAKVICSIGAVFDFYAGTVERPGRLWIVLGLEWLSRSIKEPRLAKRNMAAVPKFLFEVLRFKLKINK